MLRPARRPVFWIGLVLLASAVQGACKSSNEEPSDDDDNIVNPGGAAGEGVASGGRSSTSSGGRSTNTGGRSGGTGGRTSNSGGLGGDNPGGEANSSGGADQGGIGGGFVEPPRGDCEEEPNGEGCWDLTKCNGVDTIQFLEQCGGTCQSPFDNTARIEGFTGELPPLP